MPSKEEVRLAKERVIPVLDAWMAAFNALDLEAWKATMQYPHYRLASGRMHIWEDADMDDAYMERVRTGLSKIGWHHSVWTRREIVHCSDQKIHVDTQFTRHRTDGSLIAAHDSLYVLSRENDKWGVKLRSSYAR